MISVSQEKNSNPFAGSVRPELYGPPTHRTFFYRLPHARYRGSLPHFKQPCFRLPALCTLCSHCLQSPSLSFLPLEELLQESPELVSGGLPGNSRWRADPYSVLSKRLVHSHIYSSTYHTALGTPTFSILFPMSPNFKRRGAPSWSYFSNPYIIFLPFLSPVPEITKWLSYIRNPKGVLLNVYAYDCSVFQDHMQGPREGWHRQ